MVVAEKLRAICQQTLQYGELLQKGITPRARDFVDIFTVVDRLKLDMSMVDNTELIRSVFEAKRVPLALLGHLDDQRDFHRSDFPSVLGSVLAGVVLKDFDFYFDFVARLAHRLKPIWHE
jgi:hypothetical protein